MKNKKKEEISENSDSDCDDPSPVDDISDLKNEPDGYLETQISEEKPVLNCPNEYNDSDEDNTDPVVQQDSRNESNNIEVIEKAVSTKSPKKSVKSIFYKEELTSDDEIYILQCPESCNKQDLCNKNINFAKSNKSITVNGEVYKVELTNTEKKFLTLAVPQKTKQGSLIKLPLKGYITIHKDINKVPCNLNDNDSGVHKVVFPKDIKVRHPLLGAEWREYINSANKAIENNISVRKKNKKLKRENSIIDSPVHKKKKKKDL